MWRTVTDGAEKIPAVMQVLRSRLNDAFSTNLKTFNSKVGVTHFFIFPLKLRRGSQGGPRALVGKRGQWPHGHGVKYSVFIDIKILRDLLRLISDGAKKSPVKNREAYRNRVAEGYESQIANLDPTSTEHLSTIRRRRQCLSSTTGMANWLCVSVGYSVYVSLSYSWLQSSIWRSSHAFCGSVLLFTL